MNKITEACPQCGEPLTVAREPYFYYEEQWDDMNNKCDLTWVGVTQEPYCSHSCS